jgi:TonB family C-terminal domain
MFDNLIESKKQKQRSLGSTLFSGVVHVALIMGAVYATAHATQEAEKPKQEKVDFVETPKDEPPPPEPEPEVAPPPPPPDVVAAPPPPKGFQQLKPPMDIPDVIPEIDLSKKEISEADFSGKGVAGGTSKGVVGAPAPVVVDANQTYFEFQVEKPVAPLNNAQPNYPGMLQSQGVKGRVIAQFVVDTTGRADVSTFKVLETDHELFSAAVKSALPRMRFIPAEVGGHKVKQLVQQPFVFDIK